MHSKINSYIQNKNTTNNYFIAVIENILIKDIFKSNKLIRYNYVTQTLLAIIDNLDINNNLQWISYEQYNKAIINKCLDNLDNDNEQHIINLINRLDLNEAEYSDKIKNEIITNNNKDFIEELSSDDIEQNELSDKDTDAEIKEKSKKRF